MAYLDTSILGSYYCPEALSAAVSRALAGADRSTISPLVELEFLSLVSLKVRTKELGLAAGRQAVELFRAHVAAGLYARVEAGQREHAAAGQWLARLSTPLRTLDALHLACAEVNGLELWTTDKRLAGAAELLGVRRRLIVD